MISENFKDYELKSLMSLRKLSEKTSITFIGRQSAFEANRDILTQCLSREDYSFTQFDEKFFESRTSYNYLLLSPEFYRRFDSKTYMFIFQLDGFLFSDRLDEFMQLGFAFIGGPWFSLSSSTRGLVGGNGGVSLRKIDVMLNITKDNQLISSKTWLPAIRKGRLRRYSLDKLFQLMIWIYGLARKKDPWFEIAKLNQVNEDIAINYFLRKHEFIMPSLKECLTFSFDMLPKKCFVLNEHKLPMACHGFHKNDVIFWQKFIK